MPRGFRSDGSKLGFQKGNRHNFLRRNIKHSLETRKKMSLAAMGNIHGFKKGELVGEKNPAWKNGATLKNHGFRWTDAYKQWVKFTKNQEGLICKICGEKGQKMEVDHIRPFSLFPKLRLDKKNGRVLCIQCHKRKTSLDKKFISRKWPLKLLEDVTLYVIS